MLDRFFDHLLSMLWISGKGSRNKRRIIGDQHPNGIQGRSHISIESGLCLYTQGCRRRSLPFCQTIYIVIKYQIGDIDILSCCMPDMTGSN